MTTEDVVMVIKKPRFTVKLHKTLLEIDLNKGVKKALEDVLEANPTLRDNLGFLFQTIIPLDVPLRNIKSVYIDKRGQVKVVIPSRKDVVIPLKPNESKRLVEKLNQLISVEKEKALHESQRAEKIRKVFKPKLVEMELTAYHERIREA